MLTSQGDKEQIYAANDTTGALRLHVLSLSQSVDDTAWIPGAGSSSRPTTTVTPSTRVNGDFEAPLDLRRGHPVRRGQRPVDLPRARLPAELPRHAGPLHRPREQGHLTGPRLEPQGLLFLGAEPLTR